MILSAHVFRGRTAAVLGLKQFHITHSKLHDALGLMMLCPISQVAKRQARRVHVMENSIPRGELDDVFRK